MSWRCSASLRITFLKRCPGSTPVKWSSPSTPYTRWAMFTGRTSWWYAWVQLLSIYLVRPVVTLHTGSSMHHVWFSLMPRPPLERVWAWDHVWLQPFLLITFTMSCSRPSQQWIDAFFRKIVEVKSHQELTWCLLAWATSALTAALWPQGMQLPILMLSENCLAYISVTTCFKQSSSSLTRLVIKIWGSYGSWKERLSKSCPRLTTTG